MATLTNLNPSVKEIPALVDRLRQNFFDHPTRDIASLKQQLKSLKKALEKHRESLAASLFQDFHRSVAETLIMEFGCVCDEINYLVNHLSTLLQNDTPDEVSAAFATLNITVEKIPLGTVLIIVPFNYPLLLSLSPLIGAIAAGNNVVLKLPYDKCPEFCLELTRTLLEGLDSKRIAVVNGGIPESDALLNEKFDKIMFTGSGRVGQIVMEKAAKHLTPMILELGGKSPTFLTSKCGNLKKAIRRIVWGKFINAGQTCVAPDYLLLEDKIYDESIKLIIETTKELFPKIGPDAIFTHLVDERSFNRMSGYLDKTEGKIVLGGSKDRASLFLEPTVVSDIQFSDVLMKEELFGPILPIIRYSDLKKTVDTVKTQVDTPLAVYIFSDSKEEQQVIKTIRSGGLCINDTLMHAGCHSVPFGGIGASGFGNYHGRYSIRAFTHERAILKQPYWADGLIAVRYPPFTNENMRKFLFLGKFPAIPSVNWMEIVKLIVLLGVGIGIGIGIGVSI
ncbi:DEKNAAC103852 [Brettanomyces naardenensis]|uniref:Aldehyde dehydrogenase n=1 Tax=Brettanomyces naardenensis TaxID=13370 RepID=A0A448YPI9_BRENA|nr:DEKNAAC103852 [Brettanomyces naardenensis]